MNVVVTGGSGFIGWNLTRRLIGEGHDVTCFARPRGGSTPEGARRVEVGLESITAQNAIDALRTADAVAHLAGATHALTEDQFRAANVMPTRELLEALTRVNGNARFVYVSSLSASGPAPSLDQPRREQDVPHPVEAYGRSKLAAEEVVRSFANRVRTSIVRPCAVFGPRDRGFLALFRLAERGLILYPGNESSWLSVVDVGDLVTGLIAAMKEAGESQLYFLADPRPVSWRALGKAVAQAVGRPVSHLNVPRPLIRLAGEVGQLAGHLTNTQPRVNASRAALASCDYWVCSPENAVRRLGFKARELPAALADTYLWYREHAWVRGPRKTSPTA